MSRLLALLLIIVCFLSCNRQGKQKDAATDVAEYNLKGKTISIIQPEAISLPQYLALSNNELLVTNEESSENAIAVYDMSGHLIQSGVPYGQGPDEVLEVTSLHSID